MGPGDHLGSTSLVLNDDGTVHSEARYYPYGVTRWSSGTLPTDYRFTGQREDGYIKLTVMGARWYDGQLGRWISPDSIIPDPANPQSLNRYMFVVGNPVRYRDPNGHYHKDVHYHRTYDWTYDIAKEIAMSHDLSVDETEAVATRLALDVAGGNQFADQTPRNFSGAGGTTHWMSHKQARKYMEKELSRTIGIKGIPDANPFSFGYHLHAIQDYFAHFGQGSIAQAGKEGATWWEFYWSRDDRMSVTGADFDKLNPVPLVIRKLFARDWGHAGKSTILGIDPDEFDWDDPWDQIMVEESKYYIWEFLLLWFEINYGELPTDDSQDE
jgi:RHS repeat-associated protein